MPTRRATPRPPAPRRARQPSLEARLAAELARVRARLDALGQDRDRLEVGGDGLDAAAALAERAAVSETLDQLRERRRALARALARARTGRPPTCEDCGAPIPPARLDALPDATTCRPCQERRESERRPARPRPLFADD